MLTYMTIPTATRPIRIREDEWCLLFQAGNTEGVVTVYRNKKKAEKHIVRVYNNGKNAAQLTNNIKDSLIQCGVYCGLDMKRINKIYSDNVEVEYA